MLVLLYCPFPSENSATQAAKLLLSKKLISCANIFQSKSMYFWKGKLQKGNESILLAKTTPAKSKKAQELLGASHPYDVPCILLLNAHANGKCEQWVKRQI